MKNTKKIPNRRLTAGELLALPVDQRNRVVAEIVKGTPEQRRADSRPLNTKERAQWAKFQAKVKKRMGRPKIGKGSAVVSLSVEKDLLQQADAYAKARKLKRSQLFIQGLRAVLSGKVA